MEPPGMERRTLLAIVLALAVMIVWSYLSRPERPPVRPGTGAPSAAGTDTGPPSTPGASGEVAAPVAAPSSGDAEAAPVPATVPEDAEPDQTNPTPRALVLETDIFRLVFHERGAQVHSWRLKEFDQLDDKGRRVQDPEGRILPVELVSPAAEHLWDRTRAEGGGPAAYPGFPLAVILGDRERTRALNLAGFDCGDGPVRGLGGEGRTTQTLRCAYRSAAAGIFVEKILTLTEGSHLVDLQVTVSDAAGRPLPEARIFWGPGMGRPTETQTKDRYYFSGRAIAASSLGEIKHLDRNKVPGPTPLVAPGGLLYAGLEEKYFAAVFLPPPGGGTTPLLPLQTGNAMVELFEEATVNSKGEPVTQPRLALTLPVTGSGGAGTYALFVGPKDIRLLQEVDGDTGYNLSRLVDWGFFWFLAKPLYASLVWLHGIVGNYGLAIIILTIVIKLLFFPLTQRAMVKMRRTQEKMAVLQPRMKAVKEKYRRKKDPDSRKKMNQEIMALYQKEGVNPMGGMAGCMPLLLQLPILYGMYRVLSQALELRGAPFILWIQDLSLADPIWVTPLVMGATMLIQQLMAMTKAKDPQQKQQQRMMLFMPIMFTWFFLGLPSGLVLYWLVNNVLGIGQQWLINRQAAASAA